MSHRMLAGRCGRAAILVVLGVILGPARGRAQEPARSDSLRAQLEQTQAVMGPMMGQMTEAMMDGMLKAMAKPENAERLASFTRAYYDALIRKGFSKPEALQIVIATGLPRMPGGQ